MKLPGVISSDIIFLQGQSEFHYLCRFISVENIPYLTFIKIDSLLIVEGAMYAHEL